MAQHEQCGTAWHSHTAWVDRTPNTPRWSLICDHIVLLGSTVLYSSPAVLCSVSTVLCMSIPPCRRWRLVKVMHGRPRVRMGRLTNAYQRGRPNQNPSVLACGIPYQSLPDPVLAVRNPLVHLAWCRCPYHSLPINRSGCAPPSPHHYQLLPPRLIKPNDP